MATFLKKISSRVIASSPFVHDEVIRLQPTKPIGKSDPGPTVFMSKSRILKKSYAKEPLGWLGLLPTCG